MKFELKKIGLSAFLLVAANVSVMAETEVCSITTYFRDFSSKEEVSSSRFLVGKFDLKLEDDEVVKRFRHEEINVSVGIARVTNPLFKKEPVRIKLVISFMGEPGDNFDLLEGAEAESIYDKKWRWLSVSNSIKVNSRIYTFTFGCERKT